MDEEPVCVRGVRDAAGPGRTYLRYGCVLDLKTVPGRIDALVMGEHLYEVCIQASPPDEEALARLRARCAGQIGSWIDLLKGNLSPELLEILCAPEGGLFPAPEEWRFPVPVRIGRICASMRPQSCTLSA